MSEARALYEIANDIMVLLEQDEDGQTYEEMLDQSLLDFTSKVGSIAGYIEAIEDQAAALDARAKKISARKTVLMNKAKRLRTYTVDSMLTAETMRLTCGTHKVSVAKTPAALKIADNAVIPADFIVTKTTTSPDKNAMKALIKDGGEIPGCTLESGWRLKID